MKKRFLIFLTACILAVSPIAASANIIMPSWGPAHDFFLKNRNECIPTGGRGGRLFIDDKNNVLSAKRDRLFINDKNNVLSAKREPGSEEEAHIVRKGEELSITHTYKLNGEDWGIAQNRGGHYGWVPMSQVSLVYDSIAFDEEHKDEFSPYTGGYEALEAVKGIIVWEWPGSGIVIIAPFSGGIGIAFVTTEADNIFKITSVYTDEQGRIWGKISLMSSKTDESYLGWICISDPSNKDIPAFNPPRPVPWQSADRMTTASRSKFSIHLAAVILVTALTVGTAALIGAFWKPKKSAL